MTAELTGEQRQAAHDVLGYLNLSSGSPDARFLRNLNILYAAVETPSSTQPAWSALYQLLRDEAAQVHGTSAAFRDTDQAEAVLRLVFEHILPAYREFHQDLLFHQTPETLFRPYFLGRVAEAVLQVGGPWNETERIVTSAIDRLNDFIGHRPVAVLHNKQRMEPYDHEWVRPIPLYVAEAGVAVGKYQTVIEQALEILRHTDEEILEQAHFHFDALEELAMDPRAYDFDHPANRRINYQFGQWDPHHIDNRGRYRRFVVTQVTIEALLDRTTSVSDIAPSELMYEAAAVLAGTMLMASGVSGAGPDTHSSDTTLSTLLPSIAGFRDSFYKHLLQQIKGKHATRLREEAQKRQQPFADARQHLNRRLARLRAAQQQHVFLAGIFAKMGFPEASRRQVAIVPVASARMQCEIHCRLAAGHLAIKHGDLAAALQSYAELEDLLHRAIECGAMLDPWNLLGFGGQFSLFPALENSIRDDRAEELVDTMRDIFALLARMQSEAAAAGDQEQLEQISADTDRLAAWWDPFASTEVGEIDGFSGREAAESARHVAQALGEWYKAGAAAGDIVFWRQHVGQFNSTKAYALVVSALLDQHDLRGSASLMMQWLSSVEDAPLEDGDHSFQRLALRWMNELREQEDLPPAERWQLIRWFFDYLEANAGEYWEVPGFMWPDGGPTLGDLLEVDDEDFDDDDLDDELDDEEEDDEDPFAAAYEDVVYRDSTRDGIEGEIFDPSGQVTEYELDFESSRLHRRLSFLATLAELWRVTGLTWAEKTASQSDPSSPAPPSKAQPSPAPAENSDDRLPPDAVSSWLNRCLELRQQLEKLLAEIHRQSIPTPSANHDSLVEYDRRQHVKELLLDHTIRTMVSVSAAIRSLLATGCCDLPEAGLSAWERQAVQVLRAAMARDPHRVSLAIPGFKAALLRQPLLYVPVFRGGKPDDMVAAQSLQQVLTQLLNLLPRLGLVQHTCELLQLARDMEFEHPVGRGGVSEFDRLFTVGYRAIVEQIVLSATDPVLARAASGRTPEDIDTELVECLNEVTEKLLRLWLAHSSSLRLSVLEPLMNDAAWRQTVKFIQQYGHDLFVPMFLNEGNLRGIVHQGAEAFLETLLEDPDAGEDLPLLRDLQNGKPIKPAAAQLDRVIQAILENYAEYNDYNHTTTQSDRGEMLHCLLDFLRVKVSYDRIAWNLQPVVLAHEMLVRHGRGDAAEMWRRSVADQTAETADHHLARYQELTRKYGMQLPTVADRLQERFVAGLELDRLRALVAPAMKELLDGEPTVSFDRLEQEINQFAQTPRGVGLDVPSWLATLDDEVLEVQAQRQPELSHRRSEQLAWCVIPLAEIRQQIEAWHAQE